MLSGININPQKSFRFIKVFTNVVSRNTDIKLESPLKETQKDLKRTTPTPKEIRNASAKSNIRIQKNITPQDRFIDIMV